MSKFPNAWQEKLKQYTGEELFYFYSLCCMKKRMNKEQEANGTWVKGTNTKDMFFLGLKSKFYRYMEGKERYPIYGDAWIKLHHKFRYQFERYVGIPQEGEEETFNVEEAKIAYAKEQARLVGLDVGKAVSILDDHFKRLA